MPERRWSARRAALCLTGAAFLALGTTWIAWPGQAHADDAPGSALGSFGITATAPGFQITYDYPSASTHPLAEGDVPQSLTELQSGPLGYSLSSVAWPGSLAANAGSLSQLVNLPVPATVAPELNDPIRAEDRTGGPPTVTNDSYPGTTMTATASDTQMTADAIIAGASGPAPQSGSGSTETSSQVSVTGADSVAASAYSLVQDVTLAGLVHIAAVSSKASGTTSPSASSSSGSTLVSGLTIAGQAAYIDDSGVHLGQSGPGEPVNSVAASIAQQALSQAGMKIAISQPQSGNQSGHAGYTAGTVVFYWPVPNDSNGDTFTATFGGASISATASPGFGSGLVINLPDTSSLTGAALGTGSAGVSTAAVPTGSSVASTRSPAVAGLPTSRSASRPPAVSQARLAGFSLGHGIPPVAPVLVALGSLLIAAALSRFPNRLLTPSSAACTIGDDT